MTSRHIIVICVLLASTISARPTEAAEIHVLHVFSQDDNGGGSRSPVTIVDNKIYGSTYGRPTASGTLFRLNTDGNMFETLHGFPGLQIPGPEGALVVSGSSLYGTAAGGGLNGRGQLYTLAADGTGFTTLHDFGGADGGWPIGDLVLVGSTLYGTTSQGGAFNKGTIFKIGTDGSGFEVMRSFSGPDGSGPQKGLTLVGTTLYGTTTTGGAGANAGGTVYAIDLDGTGFHLLHTFLGTDGGYFPRARLEFSDSRLFGTTMNGGTGGGGGTIFEINTDGSGFETLHSFSPGNGDGGAPQAGVSLYGSTLYGTTWAGGANQEGTIFSINTDGSDYSIVHSFAGIEGRNPVAELTVLGGTIYGTTVNGGGIAGRGTVFAFAVPEPRTLELCLVCLACILTCAVVRRGRQVSHPQSTGV